MKKNLKEWCFYYLFLQKMQFIVVARFLLYVVPASSFFNSDIFLYYSNLIIEKLHIPVFIQFCIEGVIIFILYVHSIIFVFRNISFKNYAVYRSSNLLDDIYFASLYAVLLLLIACLLNIGAWMLNELLSDLVYKIISVYFTQIFLFYFLFKRKVFNYSVEKREKPLKT